MWEWLLPVVVRFLLNAVLKGLPMDSLKSQAKEWVYKTVPGTWADEAAWSIIEFAWDLILGEVRKQVEKGVNVSDGGGMDEVWKACSEVTCNCIPKVKAMIARKDA